MKIGSLAKMGVHFASTAHVSAYRLFGGRVAAGERTLLLTTKGRKTGVENTKPLFYVEDGGRLYVVASFGGNDAPPAWYLNLSANPAVTVETGSSKRRYQARSMPPSEAERVWPKLLAMYPAYADYQKKTTRVIPVVELTSSAT
jgi:deazaflavin-dependent oxidoreductase (nitroreductase family)